MPDYAVFNESKQFLEREGMQFSREAIVHVEVCAQFQTASSPERKKLGDNLSSLRTWRNKADYWPTIQRLKEEFFSQVRRARRIMNDLDSLIT